MGANSNKYGMREAPPEREPSSGFVRISKVEIYQGKSVISVCRKAQKGYEMHSRAVEKARKIQCSYSSRTEMQSSKLGM